MICPKCGGKTRVTDNSHNNQENESYRQRICTACHHVFYTVEIEVYDNPEFRENYIRCHRRRNDLGVQKISDPTGGLSVEELKQAVKLYKKSKSDPAYERLARFESIGMEPDKLQKAAEFYKKAKEMLR